MAKRIETIEIEKALMQTCHDKRLYGCEEITIGFVNGGLGNEIVDFMTMDSKGIIRCYEIKVSLQDLKSSAKKSWYGHFNYLVVTEALLNKINDWKEYLPENVGLMMAHESRLFPTWSLECVIKPKKQDLSIETNLMLKESMVRSLYYKMVKYIDAQSIEKVKELQKSQRYWEKLYKEENKDHMDLSRKVRRYERLKKKNEGNYIDLDDMIEAEMKKAGISEVVFF